MSLDYIFYETNRPETNLQFTRWVSDLWGQLDFIKYTSTPSLSKAFTSCLSWNRKPESLSHDFKHNLSQFETFLSYFGGFCSMLQAMWSNWNNVFTMLSVHWEQTNKQTKKKFNCQGSRCDFWFYPLFWSAHQRNYQYRLLPPTQYS